VIRRVWTVARRELAGYFDHATAYILLVVFLGVNFFFFFRDAYVSNEASLRPMVGLLPWLFLFFIPAISMRSLAEERRGGTLELVLAQPISVVEFLLGKFTGVFLFLSIALAGTLGVPLGLAPAADLQGGVILAQYVGSAFLAAALVAIGLWASSLTRNQVTAFILGVTITFALFLIGLDVVVLGLPAPLAVIASRLGILGHFQNVARGVIDVRDVLYFLAVTAAFLSLTYFSLMSERLSRARSAYRRLRVGALALVALSVFTALAGGQLRGRLDLTPGKLFTLSPAARDLLRSVDDVLTIKFFRSDEVPPEIAPWKRDIEDLLKDFAAAGGANVNLVQVDPTSDPDAQQEANTLRINPVRFNVIGEDEMSVRDGYLGIAVQYGGQSEVIPLVQQISGLEYRLASMIRSLTSETRPTVGLLTGHGERGPDNEMQLVSARLRDEYRVEEIAMDSSMTAIPDSIDVVVSVGAEAPLQPFEGRLISDYLGNGGSLLLLQLGVRIDQRSFSAIPAVDPTLDEILRPYGIGLTPSVVFDLAAHETVSLPTSGGLRVARRYPLWPVAQVGSDHIVVQGGNPVPLRWASPLDLAEADSARVTRLLVTTDLGGAFPAPVSVDIEQDWQALVGPDDVSPRVVAVAYSDDSGTRLVVGGSPALAIDEVIRGSPGGAADLQFVQNAVDWLAEDEALIAIRSKDRAPPILVWQSTFARDAAQYGNLIGVPLLFVAFGILRLARRRRAHQMAYMPGGAIL